MRTAQLMEKVAEVAPDKYAFLVKTAQEISESPYRDEIVERLDGIMKKANAVAAPSAMGRFGNAAAGIGATVAAGVAFSLANDLFEATKRGLTKGRNYKAMMKDNPDLAKMDATEVQKAFTILHRFNPEFSSEPTVAGSFVRNQAALGGGGLGDQRMLSDLVSSRKTLSETKRLPTPGKLPWETAREREKAEPNPHQEALWKAQATSADMQSLNNFHNMTKDPNAPQGPMTQEQVLEMRRKMRAR